MFRKVQITSAQGNVNIIGVTPEIRGKQDYPYGSIKTDFNIDDIDSVIGRAEQVGVEIPLCPEYTDPDCRRAILRFPGEYVIETHK